MYRYVKCREIFCAVGGRLLCQYKSYAVEIGIGHCSLVCLIGTGTYSKCTMCVCVAVWCVCVYLCMSVCVSVCLLTSYCNCFRSGSHELIGKASCTLREITSDRYYKFTFYEFIIFAPPKAKCIYIR